ncbi:FG-GAP repeat domain-containing protein [Jannaschia sp. 2305UL9-9]|uniref:FG-GAP repeat domain-containing protein n=1 Tax=Jannaschia sp. 2305UL9-9 TaxID=3121638 RepID=UPI0035283579
MILRVACACLVLAAPAAACSAPPWADAVEGSRVQTAIGSPDGISHAWYADLTDVYDHAILGDALEPTVLHVWGASTIDTCGASIAAGRGHVFEDIAPRLVDLTGDGLPEVIAIRTSVTEGGQLAIYGVDADGLTLLATTPYIGRSRRWLAPAAVADLDDDGRVEVAYVDRPHLAKVLRIWRFDTDALTEVAAISGVTNHRIGEDFISGGLRVCDGAPEIIVASADWQRMMALTFDGVTIDAVDIGPWSPARAEAALACAD